MKKFIKRFLVFTFVNIIAALYIFPSFVYQRFGEMHIDELIFVLLGNQEGANLEIVWEFLTVQFKLSLLIILLYLVVNRFYKLLIGKNGVEVKRIYKLMANSFVFLIVVGLILINFNQKFKVVSYVKNRMNASTLFEEYYVNPENVKIEFPEEKKNLIYIVLESMSNGFSSVSLNDSHSRRNIIPKLSDFKGEGISFSESENFEGFFASRGTNSTISSLVSQTSGVPLLGPINANKIGQHGSFLPGLKTIGEVLKENGYINYFAIGSDKEFAHRDLYFTTHGNYEIFDLQYWYEIGKVPNGYNVFWGIEDSKLFDYSKEKLIELSKRDEPFNYTMLTVDSHFTNGYTDKSCPSLYEEIYANAISCSDTLITDFVDWIINQDFYKDTVVVLVSDHLTMNVEFMERVDVKDKSLYNLFLNTDIKEGNISTQYRIASVVDMFPTTLGALNVKIEGNRLGIGTNLFSERETLPEEIGKVEYEKELSLKSNFYEANFFKRRKGQ